MLKILMFFWHLYQSDDRPQARAFTVGLFVATILLVWLIIAWLSQAPG